MEVSTLQIIKYALGGATLFVGVGILMVVLVTKRIRKIEKRSQEVKSNKDDTLEVKREEAPLQKVKEEIIRREEILQQPKEAVVITFYKMQKSAENKAKAISFKERCLIGRCEEKNDWAIKDDPTISTNHCCIEQKDGKLYITDLHSTNGTYINDKKVIDEVVLENHDKLRMGRSEYRLIF